MKWLPSLGAAALALSLASCTTGVSSPTTNTLSPPASVPTIQTPQIPDGFKDVGNGLAVKWLKKGDDPEFSCGHYDACTNLKVYAYASCPNGIYGKVNLKNASGTVVDWTNDTLASLSKGEYGILVFGTFDSGYTHSIVDLTCR